ncbi:Shb [Phodopus roborovskii]|uniref:Shb protein n=1 Tax=Phodopus roborovskii TaxID=109678 RepID=A0AAU9ZDV0_PHORO|nr:Shb [Phodopus roborovskii]
MAKWLNKYFSLGNSKTKSPPQPPRPDYREQRRRGERREQPPQAVPQACSASSASCGSAAACFSASSGSLPDDSGSTSDLIRAYRAQKERDFEDPYNGPGSSLRKLRAMCRLDYCGGGGGEPGGSQRAFSAAAGAAGCCCAAAGPGAAASSSSSSGSPHLYRSSSERRPATPAEVRYISPKHRLIKVESAGAAGDPPGGVCSGGRTWSPTTCGGKKLLNKCAAEETGAGQKDKSTWASLKEYLLLFTPGLCGGPPPRCKWQLRSRAGNGLSGPFRSKCPSPSENSPIWHFLPPFPSSRGGLLKGDPSLACWACLLRTCKLIPSFNPRPESCSGASHLTVLLTPWFSFGVPFLLVNICPFLLCTLHRPPVLQVSESTFPALHHHIYFPCRLIRILP